MLSFRNTFPAAMAAFVAVAALGGDAMAADAPAPALAQGPVTLAGHIKPVLEHYCFACHNSEKHKGDLNLTEYGDNPQLADNRKIWEKVAEELESRDMPP